MPPRTRTRTTKASKENIVVGEKNKVKTVGRASKPNRKVLADKTNSLSDDNASIEAPTKVKKIAPKNVATTDLQNIRPRRDRRIPTRYVENQVLNNLSNSKSSPVKKVSNISIHNTSALKSPCTTPLKYLESSLSANRPKRIGRLPPRFEDHSISPNKFIPVQPCHASTPIPQKGPKTALTNVKRNLRQKKPVTKIIPTTKPSNKKVVQQKSDSPDSKSSPDTNNNAKRRPVRVKTAPDKADLITKKVSSKVVKNGLECFQKHKNLSFKILEDRKSSPDRINLDIYEFTYDPNEEPPQKKKRKRTVRKKTANPKTVVFKNNYDSNISKALNVLKNKVTQNPKNINIPEITPQENTAQTQTSNLNKVNSIPVMASNSAINSVHETKYASIPVEDIAADFEQQIDNDINYSPVNSPHPKTLEPRNESPVTVAPSHDPLNLQDDLSFFDSQPVASSSMNVSVRHPLASPWRVEFGRLPIKWQADTYVKPNMTPAVECSFINSDDNRRKHVYTNMVAETNNTLPEIAEPTSNLKQTSIIEFMREVAEKSFNKKKRARSLTPKKVNSLFEDTNNSSSSDFGHKTPKKARKDGDNTPKNIKNVSNGSKEVSSDKETSKNSEKITDAFNESKSPENEKENTYFGFDESESQDLENVSPLKMNNPKIRALRPRSRAVLQEINAQTGPTRAMLPIAAKSKIASSSKAVNKVNEELKSAEDAPMFPDKNAVGNIASTNVDNQFPNIEDEDSQSVHLFEDIEIIHHVKPLRKSYGKAKKVTFQNHADSENDSNESDRLNQAKSSDEDDLSDPSFKMPNIKPTRTTKKRLTKKQKAKKVSKKEEREVEVWAAGFNSMCEDIEDFPLLVE